MWSSVKRFYGKHFLGSGITVKTEGKLHPLITIALRELEAGVQEQSVIPSVDEFMENIINRYGHVEDKELEYLGNGRYAVVAQHPKYPGVVVKITHDDEAYDLYASECMKHQYPWMPRITERVVVEPHVRGWSSVKMYVYIMEKLETHTEDEKADVSVSWVYRHARWATLKACEGYEPNFLKFVQNINKTNSVMFKYMDLDIQSKLYVKQYREMIFNLNLKYKFTCDIFPRNIMKRPKTGETIITDPIHALNRRVFTKFKQIKEEMIDD